MVEYVCTNEIFFWLITAAITGGILIGLWSGELLNYIRDKRRKKKNEWNYHECKECYILYPHLNVPKKCILCGNNMKKNYNKKTLKIIKFADEVKTE